MLQVALEGLWDREPRVSSSWGSSAEQTSSFSFWDGRVPVVRLRVCAWAGGRSRFGGGALARVQPLVEGPSTRVRVDNCFYMGEISRGLPIYDPQHIYSCNLEHKLEFLSWCVAGPGVIPAVVRLHGPNQVLRKVSLELAPSWG